MKTLTLATGAALVAFAGAAQANTVIALTGDRTLVAFDAETRAATATMDVTGYDGALVGIDVRPADGMLYGVGADGTVMTIDITSGEASTVSTLGTRLGDGVMGFIDFNPAADRLRIVGQDGTNLRANVDTGEVTVDGDLAYNGGEANPDIVSGAYTNSFAGTESTQLFNIDAASGWLVLQDPPNDGGLQPVGELGLSTEWAAFDILSDGQGGNAGWLVANGTVYEVNLETGAASEVGAIDGIDDSVRDIAILPRM